MHDARIRSLLLRGSIVAAIVLGGRAEAQLLSSSVPPSNGLPMYAPPTDAPPMLPYGDGAGRVLMPNAAPSDMNPLSEAWSLQIIPTGLMYRSYLAGVKEPRLGTQIFYLRETKRWMWDTTLGAKIPFLRYGNQDSAWPEGWQVDLEGAAYPRLDIDDERNVVATDFRIGVPLTYHRGQWEGKIGYVHNCSHLGDEFLLFMQPNYPWTNYVRETLVAGIGYRPIPDIRFYGESGWAFSTDGGAKPWEFQFGAEYSPVSPNGFRGQPFVAVHAHLREEIDYSGNLAVQAGWQWRGMNGQLWRFGVHYLTGKSNQYQFPNQAEDQIGAGMWYDF